MTTMSARLRAPRGVKLQKPRPLRSTPEVLKIDDVVSGGLSGSLCRDMVNEELDIQNEHNLNICGKLCADSDSDRLSDTASMCDRVPSYRSHDNNNNNLSQKNELRARRAPRTAKLDKPRPLKSSGAKTTINVKTENELTGCESQVHSLVMKVKIGSLSVQDTQELKCLMKEHGAELEKSNKGFMDSMFTVIQDALTNNNLEKLSFINLVDLVSLRNRSWESYSPVLPRESKRVSWKDIETAAAEEEEDDDDSDEGLSTQSDEVFNDSQSYDTQQSVDSGFGEIEDEILWNDEESCLKDLEILLESERVSTPMDKNVGEFERVSTPVDKNASELESVSTLVDQNANELERVSTPVDQTANSTSPKLDKILKEIQTLTQQDPETAKILEEQLSKLTGKETQSSVDEVNSASQKPVTRERGFSRQFSRQSSVNKTQCVIREPLGPGSSAEIRLQVEKSMPSGRYTAKGRREMFNKYAVLMQDDTTDTRPSPRPYSRDELLHFSQSPNAEQQPDGWSYLNKIYPNICLDNVDQYFQEKTFLERRWAQISDGSYVRPRKMSSSDQENHETVQRRFSAGVSSPFKSTYNYNASSDGQHDFSSESRDNGNIMRRHSFAYGTPEKGASTHIGGFGSPSESSVRNGMEGDNLTSIRFRGGFRTPEKMDNETVGQTKVRKNSGGFGSPMIKNL